MRPRGTGCLYRPQYRTGAGALRTSGVWHWKAPSGARFTTGQRTKTAAQAWALDRLAEMRGGKPLSHATTRYDELERILLDDWQARGCRGLQTAAARLRHLRLAFAGWDATAITTDRLTTYALRRREQHAAAGTINMELALLHRAFVLAKRAGRLSDVPIIDRLRKPPPRRGVVERGDLEAVVALLPPRYVPVVRFLYLTGWREREALLLTWDSVDGEEIRLPADLSKTGTPRRLPYQGSTDLTALLEAQAATRGFGRHVFPGRAGRPLDRTGLQRAWREACRQAGIPGAYIHDLRRTAARDLRRAGVAPVIAMAQLGHQDSRTHDGYSVILPVDQAEALQRLEALRATEPARRSVAKMR